MEHEQRITEMEWYAELPWDIQQMLLVTVLLVVKNGGEITINGRDIFEACRWNLLLESDPDAPFENPMVLRAVRKATS